MFNTSKKFIRSAEKLGKKLKQGESKSETLVVPRSLISHLSHDWMSMDAIPSSLAKPIELAEAVSGCKVINVYYDTYIKFFDADEIGALRYYKTVILTLAATEPSQLGKKHSTRSA